MRRNFKILIFLPLLVLAFVLFARSVYASFINTQNITRQSPPKPPNPPTPPTKPEPSPPPTPPCNDPGCFTPTPTPTPRPSESPAPTPTPTQLPAGGENDGTGGAPFQFGGPPPPVTGQVLGVSTLGGTGASEDNLFNLIFILGCLVTSLGIRKIATAQV